MGNNPRVENPYDLSPGHTVLLGVDFQQAFGEGAWEDTPGATGAVSNFRLRAAFGSAPGGAAYAVIDGLHARFTQCAGPTCGFADGCLAFVEKTPLAGARAATWWNTDGHYGFRERAAVGDPNTAVVEKCAFAFFRRIEFVHRGIIDDAGHDFALAFERDGNRK